MPLRPVFATASKGQHAVEKQLAFQTSCVTERRLQQRRQEASLEQGFERPHARPYSTDAGKLRSRQYAPSGLDVHCNA